MIRITDKINVQRGININSPYSKPIYLQNTIKFNNKQLTADTISISFTGQNNKKNQIENALLNIDGQKYKPFTSQIKEGEKNRRALQLRAETIGAEIDLPSQEDLADAIYTKLELQRADNKIKQALFQYNKSVESNKSTEEVECAYRKIAQAAIIADEIKNGITPTEKKKSEKIIAQYEHAKQKIDDAVFNIKIDTLTTILGKDCKNLIDKKQFQEAENINDIELWGNEYLRGVIGKLFISDTTGEDPKQISDETIKTLMENDRLLEESTFNIEYDFRKQVKAKCLGIKSGILSDEAIYKAEQEYYKKLYDVHAISREEYRDYTDYYYNN